MTLQRLWMLRITERRRYHGNEGYRNDPESFYSFDSDTANRKRIRPGDNVFVRLGSSVIGSATISRIDVHAGAKDIYSCPVCSEPRPVYRATINPSWRCKKGHEFNQPKIHTRSVEKYRVQYGLSYRALEKPVYWREFEAFFLAKSNQSVRELDRDALLKSEAASIQGIKQDLIALTRPKDADEILTMSSIGSLVREGHRSIGTLIDTLENSVAQNEELRPGDNRVVFPLDRSEIDQLLSLVRGTQTLFVNDVSENDKAILSEKVKETTKWKQFFDKLIEGAGTEAGKSLVRLGQAIIVTIAYITGALDAIITGLEMLLLSLK